MEPGKGAVGGRGEETADADGTADALGQQDLVIFGAQRGHHQAKDVHEGAEKEQVAGPLPVVDAANDRSLGNQY